MAAVEDVAQQVLLADVDLRERHLDLTDDAHGAVGAVGDRRVGVDGRDLERQIGPADAGEVGGQHEQIRPVGERGHAPGEVQGEAVEIGRILGVVLQIEDEILEREQDPGVDLERQVEVERSAARVLGVEVDLPRLAEGVGLDEVAFVVDVEAVVDGVVLEVGDEAGHIDDRHGVSSGSGASAPPACHATATVTHVTPDLAALDRIRATFGEVAAEVALALAGTSDRGETGSRAGQYVADVAADAVAVAVLDGAGYGVLSEETGRHGADRAVTVVLDPLDGSTNASRRMSWWALSLAAVDEHGLLAALVVDLRHGDSWWASRGGGATRNGESIRVSGCSALADAIIGINGVPAGHGGWAQYRAFGATALDLCAVADGTLDGYLDATTDELGSWDYLGGTLIVREAGGTVADGFGRELLVLDHAARRVPVAGATAELAVSLLALHPHAPPRPDDGGVAGSPA